MKKILICEDHQVMAKFLGFVVRETGHTPIILNSSAEDIESRVGDVSKIELPEVAILDGLDGSYAKVAGLILANSPRTDIVVYTVNPDYLVDVNNRGFKFIYKSDTPTLKAYLDGLNDFSPCVESFTPESYLGFEVG